MSELKKDNEQELNANTIESNESGGAEDLLELVLSAHEERMQEEFGLPDRMDGMVLGIVSGWDESGELMVDLPGFHNAQNLKAKAMCAVTEADLGREAVVMFEGGNTHTKNTKNPIVLGLLYSGGAKPKRPPVFSRSRAQATVDGERLVFSADKEIVLQCGEASITLTRAGKIIIRGAYVLTRSSGVNRIQGGSVQIN